MLLVVVVVVFIMIMNMTIFLVVTIMIAITSILLLLLLLLLLIVISMMTVEHFCRTPLSVRSFPHLFFPSLSQDKQRWDAERQRNRDAVLQLEAVHNTMLQLWKVRNG